MRTPLTLLLLLASPFVHAPVARAASGNTPQATANTNAHASSIARHAPSIKAAIGRVFEIKLPEEPIMVDLVRDIGLNLAYTTNGPPGFSGHTFISAQANANPDVALDTILHELSHTMDDPIIAVLGAEAARQHV